MHVWDEQSKTSQLTSPSFFPFRRSFISGSENAEKKYMYIESKKAYISYEKEQWKQPSFSDEKTQLPTCTGSNLN